MPFFASPIRVKHGSTLLVDFDNYLTSWVQISGGQISPLTPLVNATGQKTFPRANEWAKVELGWAKQYDTPDLANKAEFGFPASIPRTRASVTFTLEDMTTVYTLANASFDAWTARAEGLTVYFTLNANGGTLTL